MTRMLCAAAVAGAGLFLPGALGGSALVYDTLVVIAIFSVMAYGLDIILSDLGEISLAHTAFFAAGAYAAAIATVTFGISAWPGLAAAVFVSIIMAAVLGFITLGMRDFAFSLVTYAAAVVLHTTVANTEALGGSDGFVGIPTFDLSIGPLALNPGSNKELWPYAYAMLLAVIYFVHRFRRSRLGQAALMVHMNPGLALMSGLDAQRIRLYVFLVSAPVSAIAGWFYAYQRAYVGPDLFDTYFLVLMLTAVILVGRRILIGPVVGTAILIVQKGFFSLGAYGDKLLLGAVLVAVLCLFPGGLASIRLTARLRLPSSNRTGSAMGARTLRSADKRQPL